MLNFQEKLPQDPDLTTYFILAREAINCCEIGENKRVKIFFKDLKDGGNDVNPILSPTVPEGKECLRFSLHAFNTTEEITQF